MYQKSEPILLKFNLRESTPDISLRALNLRDTPYISLREAEKKIIYLLTTFNVICPYFDKFSKVK